MDSSVSIFLHTCRAFNYEPLVSRWKTVNNHTALSSWEWFQGTLGDDLFPCRLMFVQAVITPTPCVKEICCFATLAGCKPLTPSFCGWKTLRRFSKERVKSTSNVEHLFSFWNYENSRHCSVYRLHQVNRRGWMDMLGCYGKCFPPSAALCQSAATGD